MKRAKKRSAIATAYDSGLKIVPKPKRKGPVATVKQIAAIDWKPWERGDEEFVSGELMRDLGLGANIAYGLMCKTRDELIAFHGEVDHSSVDEIMGLLLGCTERFKTVAQMTEAAYIRVLAAAAARVTPGGEFVIDGKLQAVK